MGAAARKVATMKNLHDNKGNGLCVFDPEHAFMCRDEKGAWRLWPEGQTAFMVTRADGTTTGPFRSYSGAAKSITGYEVNGRRYWKFNAPDNDEPRWQLVCEFGEPLEADLVMTAEDCVYPIRDNQVIHLHKDNHLHEKAGLCDTVNDEFIPDNDAAYQQYLIRTTAKV